MPTNNDLQFLEGMYSSMRNRKPPGNIPEYRDLINSFEPVKNVEPMPEVGEWHEGVEVRQGLRANIAVPKGPGPHPIAVMTHGNGYAAGSAHSYRRFTRDFAHNGYVAILVDYRLAPERQFPAALEDAKFTCYWASENGRRYKGDPSRMVIVGDSTGGGLAAATLIALHCEPDAPKFKAAMLLEGVYDFYTPIHNDPKVAELLIILMKAYLGPKYSEEMLKDPQVSPIYGLKPGVFPITFLMQGTADIVAPYTAQFAQEVQRAGIPYELHMVEGMPHGFMTMPTLDGGRLGQALMFDFLKRNV